MSKLKVGNKYYLNLKGVVVLRMLRLCSPQSPQKVCFRAGAIVTVIKGRQDCDCGTQTRRHTDGCSVYKHVMELPNGVRVSLSENDVFV